MGFDRTITYNNGVNIPYDSEFRIAPANKILLCIEGGSAGRKIAITNREVNFGNKLACFNTFIINDLYLLNILQSSEFFKIFRGSLTGIIGGVSINTLKEFLVPLPPIQEQKRIVTKIDSFEPLINKYGIYEQKISELEESLPEKLKKSILQYAIEGKLVKQDPNDEPASVLLERIKAEKEALIKTGKIKRDKNVSAIYQGDDKNYYENLPNNFIVTYLSNAGNWRSGSTPDRGNSEYYHGTIKWIKTGELNNGIVLDSVEKVTDKALKECSLPINDIGNVLIAMYGATIGKLGIAGTELTTNQACCGCKPFSGIYNKYLFYYLMYYKQKFIDSAEGGAQPNISREKILASPFILPSSQYQIRLVNKIEVLFNRYI